MSTKKWKNNTPVWELSKHIHNMNKSWNELSDIDKKSFNKIGMINYLSMHVDYIDIINYLSQYVMELSDEQVYTMLHSIFKQHKPPFIRFIKNENKIVKSKLLTKLIRQISNNIMDSTNHIEHMIFVSYRMTITDIVDIMNKLAYSDKDIELITTEVTNIINNKN